MTRSAIGATALLLLLIARASGSEPAPAAHTLTLSSGPLRVSLLELYTSEGCSSCPPADRWMSALQRDPALWRRFVPIAFHVDYWDHIGWKDRFSNARYSDRQRRYARQGGAGAVYTPGFFRDGMEWRDWRSGAAPTAPPATAGALRVEIVDDRVSAQFAAADVGSDRLTVHVAVLGMGLTTRVAGGENKGRTLRHDFVALGVRSAALARDQHGYRATLTLPDTVIDSDNRAVVAWVTQGDRLAPLQAVGGLL